MINRNNNFMNKQIINNVLRLYVKGLDYTRIIEIMNERLSTNYYSKQNKINQKIANL
ncbi:hypothetical protein CPJCM30710_32400 [Clostridium polyendosporum]|uniref:Uncharacterized protein n=1 Tax=Clostridium polyendosporum TaxID=69208 RepID=A0A919S328_9CLOT|nr:hypothetical protein CPJCM30710_32400 [Clostridium polyendosporum]